MNKIYKKLIGVSLILGSLLSICAATNAMVTDKIDPDVMPVFKEEKKEEDKEDKDEDKKDEKSKSCMLEIAEKGLEAAAKVAKQEMGEKIEEKKEDLQEEGEKVKEQVSSLVEKIGDNMQKITEKQEEASEKADEQKEAADKIKEQEDKLKEQQKNMELKDNLSKQFETMKKTQQDSLDKFKEKITSAVTENSDSSKEQSKE